MITNSIWRERIAAFALGVAALPILTVVGAPLHGNAAAGLVSLAASVAGLWLGRLAQGRVQLSVFAGLLAVVAAFTLLQAQSPGSALIAAPGFALTVGLSLPPVPLRQNWPWACGGVVLLLTVWLLAGRSVTGVVAVCWLLASVAMSVSIRRQAASVKKEVFVAGVSLLLVLATLIVIGSTTPRATWFGALTYHGPRSRPFVAITFDDGPDPPYTLAIRDVLDRYGVKATFFSVAGAVAQRPDVSQALLADGHLIGNHSYHHDATSWLDPRYPELGLAERTIKRELGVCPVFYRPPHGTHTPFMSLRASREGMRIVNWDVSAGDWATADADLVAQRVLKEVRAGSIILLHDGLDGHIGADRSVVVEALPAIIEGLKLRGLEPVTLDKLLGRAGYLASC